MKSIVGKVLEFPKVFCILSIINLGLRMIVWVGATAKVNYQT